MSEMEDRYIRMHPRSQKLASRAGSAFPGGVTHDTRFLRPFPLFMESASECMKQDVDGLEYVDYVMGHGALLLGHSHPGVTAAVCAQAGAGTHLGANTRLELEWFDAVRRLLPSVEKIRFHSSGTEAVAMAIRLARAATGKDLIVKLTGHFHGWNDYLAFDSTRFSSAGIPRGVGATVRTIPASEPETLFHTLEAGDVAAVILEPTGARMGRFPLRPELLHDLRTACDRSGVVLIFDEIVTGFRVSRGGAQERYGIRPDLTALGKILAGGLPGAAVGGRADLLDMIAYREDPEWNRLQRVGHPGTFNANAVSAAAGCACLTTIADEAVNARADEAASRLSAGINTALSDLGVPGFAYGLASLVWVILGAHHEADGDGLWSLPHTMIADLGGQLEQGKALKLALLNEGVDIMGGSEFIVSAAHTDAVIDVTIEAFQRAVEAMKRSALLPQVSS